MDDHTDSNNEGKDGLDDAAEKVALTVRLLTVSQTPEEKTKAQNMLRDVLLEFAAEVKRSAIEP